MIMVVGEALIDLIPDPAGRYTALPGGAPANVSVAAARLGHPTAFAGRISTAAFGDRIRRFLTENGVDLRHSVDAAQPATLAVVTLATDGAATYDFYATGTADWQWRRDELPVRLDAGVGDAGGVGVAREVDFVYFGSLAAALEPGATVIEEFIRTARGSVPVCYDPNIRPGLLDAPARAANRVDRQVGLATVVKASVDDLRTLHPRESPEAVARRWAGLGPELVLVTLGAAGAFAVTREQLMAHHPGIEVSVVDTVGAGDAFSAAIMVWLARHGTDRIGELGPDDLRDLLGFAARVSALTCTRPGADPPTADQL